jgi:four helix bundle protein
MMKAGGESSHRSSIAWQKGMQIAKAIYELTSKFPVGERFGLTNQLRRAFVSIPSNIPEGKGRTTTGDLIHFLAIARGSTLEVQTQLELAEMLGFGDSRAIAKAQELVSEEIRILNASLKTLRDKLAAHKRP